MGETRVKSRAALKAKLADYSQGACAQLERPGIASSIKNWVSYSAAAASALAAVTSADAGVIYSGIRNVVSRNLEGYDFAKLGNVDIDGDGNIEFQVIGYEEGKYGVGKIKAPAPLSATGINAIFVSLYDGDAIRFLNGQTLGTKGSFKRLVVLGAQAQSVGKNYGNFQNTTMGFVGFRFKADDGYHDSYHYGWIRLHLENSNPDQNSLTDTVTAIDWAYESEIGAPIRIGDIGASVPEPSSLTIVGLAMGCAALPALRRRRKLRKAAASQAGE